MKKLILIVVFSLIFSGLVGAVPVTIDVVSPTHGQTIVKGEAIQLDFSIPAGVMNNAALGVITNQGYINMFNLNFPTQDKASYKTTIDTGILPTGIATFMLTVGYYTDPQDYSSFQIISKNIEVIISDSQEPPPNGPVVVTRSVPDTIYPNGWVQFGIFINPIDEFPGIIINESNPEGMTLIEPIFPPFMTEESHIIQDGIVKIVLRNKDNIKTSSFYYGFLVPDLPEGTEIPLSGTWAIEGAQGPIGGKNKIKIAGLRIPSCPFSDQELLGYISQWASEDLSNIEMLQVIQRWKECQNPVPN